MRLVMEKRATPQVRGAFVGKNVYLRPASIEDYETVLMWQESLDPQRINLGIEAIAPLSSRLAQYRENPGTLLDTSFADLTIVNRDDEGLIGMLSYSDLNLLNRSAKLGVYGAPDSGGSKELQEALSLLVNYMFFQFNLNSVYAEVSELDRQALGVFEALEFKQDGVLRQRHFFDGTFHDIRAYSLLRFEAPR